MKTVKWWSDDRRLWIGVSAAAALCALAYVFRSAALLEHWGPRLVAIIGAVAAIFCVGLCLRQEWSRWMGLAWMAGAIVLALSQIWWSGFTLLRGAVLVAAPLAAWNLWRLPITKVQEILNDPELVAQVLRRAKEIDAQVQSQPRWKVILLFDKAPELDARAVAQAAEEAFSARFAVMDGPIDPTDAAFLPHEHPEPVVAGASPVFVCHQPPHLLGIYYVPSPCPADLAESTGDLDATARQAVEEHAAFVEIEMLPCYGNYERIENGCSVSGKLAAALMDSHCVAVFVPEANILRAASPEARDALRCSVVEWRL